ncbi:PREDICTED: RING finger protein 166-like, partial [Amphimedon queenslandica]|uniref:RING-type domain-containing protein n=1 Tax=Amphimedon queenslandica TaxID=400682 RepID=A0AAN0ISI7_AMPQE
MAQFSKDEVSFLKELPEHVEIECPICLNILTDPHQVTCCGHNYCGSCIERVKDSDGSCPMCKEEEYQSFVDKKCLRIINGLEVYCRRGEENVNMKKESVEIENAERKGNVDISKITKIENALNVHFNANTVRKK